MEEINIKDLLYYFKKNIFIIFVFVAPIVLNTAISWDFSFTNITKLEIILKDATNIIKVKSNGIEYKSQRFLLPVLRLPQGEAFKRK